MKCIRTPIEAEVTPYELSASLEDGFAMYADVVTRDYVDTTNLVQTEVDGVVVCPYILTRRGKTFIKEGDYIIVEEDGTKVVCGADKVFSRYKPV